MEHRRLFSIESKDSDGTMTAGCCCAACLGQGQNAPATTADFRIAAATEHTTDRIWAGLESAPAAEGRQSYLNPKAYEPFLMDVSRMQTRLTAAGQEQVEQAGVGRGAGSIEVSIPTPEGTLARFNLVESSIMAPELQAEFSDIRTYAGFGVDDPSAYIRASMTPLGFHAVVLSPGSTFYVDPLFHLDRSTYASYYQRDSRLPEGLELAECLTVAAAGSNDQLPIDQEQPTTDVISGTQLRTYRTAVAGTAEYTAFFGGTVALGQAGIVNTINRINAVYELELSIRLSLVANNNLLVFTDAATDGYTNGNLNSMINENQVKIDAVIGSANYDVGHVFGRPASNGGGLAQVSSVGVNGGKARAGSQSAVPSGDGFDVQLAAHEFGHQFGANHTFNTVAGAGAGNRNGGTAYEPGSGSTIMSYAGITGPGSDIQGEADPYFHWISQQEIINRCDFVIPGVGTRTATGNSVPTVGAGTDYFIPTNTPFMLTGFANDANGDTIFYSWEQADLGPAQTLVDADNGASPLFRSLPASTSPSRMFPNLGVVLAGLTTNNAGEKLPSVPRAMDFRLGVRDNRPGGGGYNTDDMIVNVVNTGAAFSITSFNAFVTMAVGSAQTINWNVAGTTGGSINTANVRITMSTDGGATFPIEIAASTPNDGSHAFTTPNNPSTTVRFKVEAIGNIFFDISNANVTVGTTAGTSQQPGQPSLTAASDTGVSNSDNITRLNNNSPANALSFSVPNTVAGATVSVVSDGVTIGSAVATGTTTIVTTNGVSLLADGLRSVLARQTEPFKAPSNNSVTRQFTVDSVGPAGVFLPFDRTVGPAHQVRMLFSENVQATLEGTDLVLTNNFGTGNGTPAVAFNTGTNTATFTFPDQPNGGILNNGNYSSSLVSNAVTDVAGNGVTNAPTGSFFFLNGDADNNKSADIDDFGILATNFNQPGTIAQGNFNYVGLVDIDDFSILAVNFNATLPGGVPRPAAAGAPASGPFSDKAIGNGTRDLVEDLIADSHALPA